MSNILQADSAGNRVQEVDLLRGIAILMVVAVHVFGNYSDMNSVNALFWLAAMTKIFARVGVPLFLLLSAIVLSNRYFGQFTLSKFYRKRLRVLLGPYLAFSFLYITVYGFLNGWPDLTRIFRQLVMATASEHLWFFRLIFLIYFLYPALVAIYGWFEKKRLDKMLLGLVLMLQIVSCLFLFEPTNSGGSGWTDAKTFLFTVPRFIFYFFLGIWIGRNFSFTETLLRSLRIHQVALLTVLILEIVFMNATWVIRNGPKHLAAFSEPALFTATMAVFYYVVSRRTGSVFLTCLRQLGSYAYGIFLIHILFLGAFAKFLRQLNITADASLFYLLLFTATLFFSYAAVWVIHRTPLSDILLGMRPFLKEKERNIVS